MAVDINGDGLIGLGGTSTTQGRLRLSEDTDNGTNYVELQAPANIASNFTLTLPSADGTSGQVLQTNGSGALSFGSGGFSGATINAVGSSAITLTNASTQYQRIQINSAANSSVTLPNATTLSTEGAYPFVIENRSPINQVCTIKNNGGEVVGLVRPAYVADCSLVDNGTANGTWAVQQNAISEAVVGIPASLTSTALTSATGRMSSRVIALTSTKFLIYYLTSSQASGTVTYTIRIRVGDISGNTITYGSEQTTTYSLSTGSGTGGVDGYLEAIRLSDSAFVLYHSGWISNTDCTVGYTSGAGVRTCTVSGTTVTFGTASALSFPLPNGTTTGINIAVQSVEGNRCLVRMSDTKFAVIYNTAISNVIAYPTAYSGSLTCNIITVSGTTQTIGTKVDLGTSTFTQVLGAVCYDTDKLLVVYGQGTSGSTIGRSKVVVVTVSGTTPTWNTPVNVQGTDSICQTGNTNNFSNNLYAINTSNCFVPYIDTTAKGAIVSISVTTPTIAVTASLSTDVWDYGPVSPVTSSVLITEDTNNFLFVSTSGLYEASINEVLSAQSRAVPLSSGTASTSLVTINGAGAGSTLITVLATAGPN